MVLNLIGAAAGAVSGGMIDDIFNKAAADRSYEMNRRLQKHDQEFQKEMRATQYQTTVEDMQKAGINPAVALSGGASLSSQGGGSSASASAPSGTKTNIAETMMSLKSQQTQIDNQTALTNADVELKRAQAVKTMREAGYTEKQIEYYMKYGVFPGATIKTSGGGNIFGVGGNVANEYPIGYKFGDKNNGNKNSKRRDFEDMTRFL